jgi:membrane protease YdiL (CAAX protease family)
MSQLRHAILWSIFLATAFVQLAGSVLYFFVLDETSYVQPVYLLTKLMMLVSPPVLLLLGFRLPRFSLGRSVRLSVFFGVTSGLAISGVIFGVFTLFRPVFLIFADNIAVKVETFGILPYYLAATIIFSLGHSLFEEYFWRWYVVRGLQTRLEPARAILLGGLFFSLHHFIVLSQFFPWGLTLLFGITVGVGGIIWSWAYKKTDSLLGPWISHALVDGTLFLIGYILLLG